MDILSLAKKTRDFKQLYRVPYALDGTMPTDLEIAMYCNPCYGFGDIIFCLKLYNYIKEWYGLEPTLFVTRAKPFIQAGIKKIFMLKAPGKPFEECEDITKLKIYNMKEDGTPGRRVTPKIRYDLIFITPWVSGADHEPNHKLVKNIFPYSNRFNTFLFSEYNPSLASRYDFPTGIGKNLYGLLITDWNASGPRIVENPYLMAYIGESESVDVTMCFKKFIKLMCKKYYKKYPKLDVIMPKHILNDEKGIQKLIDYIIENGYYDAVDIITSKDNYPKHDEKERVLRFRTELVPMPYDTFVSLFNYCLPDVLITGDQSVTDIVSCCKNYTIYYQIMPWKLNLAKNLSKVSGAKDNYLGKVRSSCGLEKLTRKKLDLAKVARDYDFRKLAKPVLDRIVNNARLLTTDKDVEAYVDIVLGSRKKASVIRKYEDYLEL
jgi:hypothetical protein